MVDSSEVERIDGDAHRLLRERQLVGALHAAGDVDEEREVRGLALGQLQPPALDAEAVQTGDHERLITVNSTRFENPRLFVERIAAIYRTSPPESFDVLSLRDGRLFERASKIQFVECFGIL